MLDILGKITTDDIASMVGVTKSTVSRYFNGGSVKESTRIKIQEVIEEYRYESNTFARLKTRESNVTGAVLPILNSKIASRVVINIGRFLREQGYEALIKDPDHSVELELKNIQRLIVLKADGTLLSAIITTEEHRELIRNSSIPVAVLIQDYDQGNCVVYDNYGAGKAMGSYIGREHPVRVGCLGMYESDEAVGITRKKRVLDGLREWNVDNVSAVSGGYSYESGIRMTEELLDQDPLDALICATDHLAFGTYRVLAQRGLRVPEDVPVVGFGGYDESTLLKPELTTPKFDSYGSGYLGAKTLLKVIKEKPVPKKQVVNYRMIEGGSVKKRRRVQGLFCVSLMVVQCA